MQILPASDTQHQPGVSPFTVWGSPGADHLPNGRWKRRPDKLWVKGKRGFTLGRRKTGVKQKKKFRKIRKSVKAEDKHLPQPTSSDHSQETEFLIKKIKHKSNQTAPVKSVISTNSDENKTFVDFGNRWKNEEDNRSSSVKVKRKHPASAPLPRKGKHLKSPKSKDRKTVKVATVKNYCIKNVDGSITWGYVTDDGSYKVSENLALGLLLLLYVL
jgi:hypothetical protein